MRIDIIVEDSGHELFIRPLIYRLAAERNIDVELRVLNAVGGRPKVLEESRRFVSLNEGLGQGLPDTLVVATDGNCVGFVQRRNEINSAVPRQVKELSVVAIPDPHIERWFLADPQAFQEVVGVAVTAPARKCDRTFYKNLLAKAVSDAGIISTLGGLEMASDIVTRMDVDQACRNDSSLNNFVRSFRGALARFAR